MTTTLTKTGWTGYRNGIWTSASDKVIDIGGIVVDFGTIADTLAGKDSITGSGGVDTSKAKILQALPPDSPFVALRFGIENFGAIIMGDGKNSITGIATDDRDESTAEFVYGIYNEEGSSITMYGNHNSITGKATGDAIGLPVPFGIFGIYNRSGSITMEDGDHNSITGIGKATVAVPVVEGDIGFLAGGIFNRQDGSITMGDGNHNSITGRGGYYNGIYNRGSITMGDGDHNSITGTGISDGAYGIYNENFRGSNPTITIGNGNNNSITGRARGSGSVGIFNDSGCTITMGDGHKNSITGRAEGTGSIGIRNGGNFSDDPTLPNPTSIITMGDGNNNSITGRARGSDSIGIANLGTINMGSGNDSLKGTGDGTGIQNLGIIDMGDGNDKVIANGGFTGNGSVFLRAGNDYLKGFGSGTFDGGLGADTIELTEGVYTVGISGKTVTFTDSNDIIMNTCGFEKLIAGCTTYNFTCLSNGQTIWV